MRRAHFLRFCRARRGVAALEFALIAPVALFVLVAFYVYCDALSVKRKLTIAAHSVGDLIARQSSVSPASLTTFLNAAAQIAAPYPLKNMTIVVAELSTDAKGKTAVTWSQALNGAALTPGATFTPPNGLAQANSALIYSNVTYHYTPIIGAGLIGSFVLHAQYYATPRVSASVAD